VPASETGLILRVPSVPSFRVITYNHKRGPKEAQPRVTKEMTSLTRDGRVGHRRDTDNGRGAARAARCACELPRIYEGSK